MTLGPLFIGWITLDESDRFELGIDPHMDGWEALHIGWNGRGFILAARARRIA